MSPHTTSPASANGSPPASLSTSIPRPADRAGERAEAARRLEEHRVFDSVRDVRSLRTFMEHHVVCVFDFMTLLKRLQTELTCSRMPWVPADDPVAARLINSIVVDEESDDAFGAEPRSHFEWYVEAMEEVGANTAPIQHLVQRIGTGVSPAGALADSNLPAAARAFSRTTFELAAGPLHVAAAAFVYGRENVIPGMFVHLVRELSAAGLSCDLFVRYLERHIEVDSHDHGPAARSMLERLVGKDPQRENDVHGAALRALAARERLWDETARACIAAAEPDRLTVGSS